MKRFLTAILAIAAVSCARMEEASPVEDQQNVRIVRAMRQSPDSTRTDISGADIVWKSGDAVWVGDGKNSCRCVVAKEYDGCTCAELVTVGLSPDGPLYALYPYCENARIVDSRVEFPHPVKQDGTFGGCQTMSGVSDANDCIQMLNRSAYLSFSLHREDILNMQISSCAGDSLAGGATAAYSSNISIDFDGTGTKYASVLPSLFRAGTRLVFVTGSDRVGHIVTTKDNVLVRAGLYDMGEIDDRMVFEFPPATDLSETESANCYIVSESGSYKFKAVKGNGKETVGDIAYVDLLWETTNSSKAPDTYSIICDCIPAGDWIYFNKPAGAPDGNALLAAFDIDGNVLWSWHIWSVSDIPVSQTYDDLNLTYSEAVMMDRNLGALSGERGSVGSLGLLYQWGRKDPFFGAASISSKTPLVKFASKYHKTLPQVEDISSATGTVEYTVAHPCTFLARAAEWQYSTDYSVWSAASKTIYDPCPPGYHIPEESAVSGFSPTSESSSWSSTLYGRLIEIDQIKVWYPAPGLRGYSDQSTVSAGDIYNVGSSGNYWYDMNTSPYGNNYWSFTKDYCGIRGARYGRSAGFAVRCQKRVSTSSRQTVTIYLTTSLQDQRFYAPMVYGFDFSGRISWGDSEISMLSKSDSLYSRSHRYAAPGSYTPAILAYDLDSLTIPSLGDITKIDVSGF